MPAIPKHWKCLFLRIGIKITDKHFYNVILQALNNTKSDSKMKRTSKIILVILCYALFLASCTMEKRHYQSGYYLDWKKGVPATASTKQTAIPATETTIEKLATTDDKTLSIAPSSSEADAPVSSLATSANSNNDFTPTIVISTTSGEQIIPNATPEKIKTRSLIRTAKTLQGKLKSNGHDDIPLVLLIILCIFLPFVAVGIMTDWKLVPVLSNLAWTFLGFWICGIIHAFYIKSKYGK